MIIFPLNDEAQPVIGARVDEAMDRAGQSLAKVVGLRGRVAASTERVAEATRELVQFLPGGETNQRLAQNYAQLLVATELVRTCMPIFNGYQYYCGFLWSK